MSGALLWHFALWVAHRREASCPQLVISIVGGVLVATADFREGGVPVTTADPGVTQEAGGKQGRVDGVAHGVGGWEVGEAEWAESVHGGEEGW